MTNSHPATENGTATATATAEPLINPNQPDLAGVTPVEDEAYFVVQIRSNWNKSLDNVLEVGRLLNKAAGTMPKKAFRRKFAVQLPFSYSVAQRLRKLGKSERINDPKNRSHLPFSWNTLAAIDNLSDEAFERGIRLGVITPRCEFKDIKRLRDEETYAELLKHRHEPETADASSQLHDGQPPHSEADETDFGLYLEKLEADDVAKDAAISASMKEVFEKAAAAHSAARLAPPTKKLSSAQLAKAKTAKILAMMAAPKPLHVWMSKDVMDAHRDELATLIEGLNRQLPSQYSFISEVKMGVPK